MGGVLMKEALLGAALGIGFLHAFYRALETQWPASYFSVSNAVDRSISVSLWRYLTFRTGPILAVGLFAVVSVDRAGGIGWCCAVLIGAVHWALTSGRAIFTAARLPTTNAQRNPLVVLHLALLPPVALSTLLAIVLAGPLSFLVPPIETVSSDLWTAVAAAVLGAYLVRVVSGRQQEANEAVERSRLRIKPELWREAEKAALANSTDPALVKAIMVAENLQRPTWFRALEGIKGRLMGAGSYGIMQIQSEKPLGDVESIWAACQGHLHGVQIPIRQESYGARPDMQWLQDFVRSTYNDDEGFASTVVAQYYEFAQRP
jgi:hypothetical protein